jgi:hypothetical protein
MEQLANSHQVTKLFAERLAAWRAVVSHLEDYVTSTEKLHHGVGKDYEKIVKVLP